MVKPYRVLLVVSFFLVAALGVAPRTASAQEGDDVAVSGSADAEELQLIYLSARGGLGRFSEQTIDQTQNGWLAGFNFRWYPNAPSRLSADFQAQGYTRDFIQIGLGQGGGITRVQADEIRFTTFLDYSYNWLDRFGMELWTGFGWRFDYFDNDYIDEKLTGAYLTLIFAYPLTRWITAFVGVDYTYNLLSFTDLLNYEGSSLTGQPQASLRWMAGFSFNINDVMDVGLVYQGEHIPYDRSDLLYNYVLVVVGVPIRF